MCLTALPITSTIWQLIGLISDIDYEGTMPLYMKVVGVQKT